MWSIWGSLASAGKLILEKSSEAFTSLSKERIDTPPQSPAIANGKQIGSPAVQLRPADLFKEVNEPKIHSEPAKKPPVDEEQFRRRKRSRRSRRDNTATEESDKSAAKTSEASDASERSQRESHPKYANGAQPFPRKKIGKVFWMMKAGPVLNDITEVELPIDDEVLEDVVNGKVKLEKQPLPKRRFDPYGSVDTMKKDNKCFGEKAVFANTVTTVLRFRPTKSVMLPVSPNISKTERRQVKWKDTMTVCEELKSKTSKPLRDVVKKVEITAAMI